MPRIMFTDDQVAHIRATLDRQGYVLVEDLANQQAAMELLGSVGVVIPQYDTLLTHEVTYQPAHQARLYSQSTNTLRAHTEGSGWQPPPALLALYCHRQARCGGGHTDLLDVQKVLDALVPAEVALLTEALVDFPWPVRGNTTGVTRSAMLYAGPDGRRILRFNFNILTANGYDPAVDAEVAADHLPLGEAGRTLAHHVNDVFEQRRTRILIPERAMLIWDNRRMLHGRSEYADRARHLTRFFVAERGTAADRSVPHQVSTPPNR